MVDVFISYSRKDEQFVRQLYEFLIRSGRSQNDIWIDWQDIPLTADWWREIQKGIEGADTFAFVISPNSVNSEVCYNEIEHAVANNKRFVPILYRDLIDEADKAALHPAISSHNWIFMNDRANLKQATQAMLDALETDLHHVREHTRLLVRAKEWAESERNNSLLLTGSEIQVAEQWFTAGVRKNPHPTDLHAEYITTSRKVAHERQRRLFIAATAAMLISLTLAIASFVLFQDASTQRNRAEDSASTAIVAQQEAVAQAMTATVAQGEALFQAATAAAAEADAQRQAATAVAAEMDAAAQAATATIAQGIAQQQAATAVVAQEEAQAQAATATIAQGEALLQAATATVAQGDALFQAATAAAAEADAAQQAATARAAEEVARQQAATAVVAEEDARLQAATAVAAQATGAANSSRASTLEAIVSRSKTVLLRYDDRTLVFSNLDMDEDISLRGLQFVQPVADGNDLVFDAEMLDITESGLRLAPGQCFQLWTTEVTLLEQPDFCESRRAWLQLGAPRWFWLNDDPNATFEVRRNNDPIATCRIGDAECLVILQ
ncbi:MAG: toll/interleukin-1 receptor domain-containing protein [Chloroflexi bacterium]|nr:MAG: toll/interleukin-1 receptor domain-containing protein [Chloroflexota bacterium]